MSFDLYLWKAPIPADAHQAAALLERYFIDGKNVFEKAADLKALYRELRGSVPKLDAVGDLSDSLITLNLLWGTGDAVLDSVARLAAKYGMVLYDPQADVVHPPSAGKDVPQLPPGEANPIWWRRFFGGSGG